MQYRMEVRNSPEVTFALKVFSSLNSNNYVRFFKLLRSASYLNACIMHRYFTQVRSRALQTMTKAYRPQEPYPQQALLNLLTFEDKEEVRTIVAPFSKTWTLRHGDVILTSHCMTILTNLWLLGMTELSLVDRFLQLLYKLSVLRRQSRDTNRNIKRLVYCQYG